MWMIVAENKITRNKKGAGKKAPFSGQWQHVLKQKTTLRWSCALVSKI